MWINRPSLRSVLRKGHFVHLLRLVGALCLSLIFTQTTAAQTTVPMSSSQEPSHPDEHAAASLQTRLGTLGSLPLIIQLDVPGYDPAAFDQVQAASIQEAAVATAQDALLGRMAHYALTNVKTFPYIPFLALTIQEEAALNALHNDPAVLAITEDQLAMPLLSDSVPLIRADSAHSIFYRGNGQVVVILDTGVDKNHAALVGKVVAEACYSTTNATFNSTAICPGGGASSTANNSGLNCTASINGCDHGTHVAGIAAGVAPGAQLMSMQVFSRMDDNSVNTPCSNAGRPSPCTQSYTSDQVSALNRVYALRNSYNIASINMSLGGGQFASSCDNNNSYASIKSIIDLLRGAGITTVIAAGNSGYRNAMGAPACLSAAVAVGATTKSDQVASYSNLSTLTTLFAPGSDIYAPIPSNQFDDKNGTSMAAPHVAGAIAVLKQALPTASATQIRNALQSTGPLISDQRAGGTVSKRRLDVYSALCQLITCDSDDYRYLSIPQTVSGAISNGNDRDHYFIYNVAGTQVTLHMDRTSGNLDPYLELYDPNGNRVALNNNGGTGNNALINGYTFQLTGRYQIIARSTGNTTGNYTLRTSQQSVVLNPQPQISSLSPSSATGTLTGNDFWVQINGSGFTSQTTAYWNGQSRTPFYSSPTRMWIRVRGSDLGFPWPRTASIQVRNPEPGGGYSNQRSFSITFPFLGTSELVQPASGATAITGIQTTFVLSWTHPTDSWRTMQQMDLRLRDQNNKIAAWIRVVERPGATSVYRLLNGAEVSATVDETGLPDEGLPGEARNLVITDTVTLHLADSAFTGSGRTAIMSPTVTFGPAAVGVYNIEFQVDSPDGAVQADDLLGQLQIVPAECPFAVERVTLSGPTEGNVNTSYDYSATVEPIDATAPISYTWSPEPASGQGTANATYNFTGAGEYPIFLGVENCGSFAADLRTVKIYTSTEPDLTIHKSAPTTVVAGEPLTYTLTITNSGALTATNLFVIDDIPSGASYLTGGTRDGNIVQWAIPSLAGYGAVTQTTYVVSTTTTLTNSNYSVNADGGYRADGTLPVVTKIVAAQQNATALTASTLAFGIAGANHLSMTIPAGAVADATRVTVEESAEPTHSLPSGKIFGGRAFGLAAYQANQRLPSFTFGETISLTLTYSESVIGDADESTLALYQWDGSAWSDSGITCAVDTTANQASCTLDAPSTTDFALFAAANVAPSNHLLYLPLIQQNGTATTPSLSVQITDIGIGGETYVIAFQTTGFTPAFPGTHMHFYFNTTPSTEAGLPGNGPWWLNGAPSPFAAIKRSDRPAGATQLCVLVANNDHTVQQGTGNCYPLP